MNIPSSIQNRDLISINDLDRPALPIGFPDYRDLMVIDQDSQNFGRIVDILINREDRRPLMAVVLFGGFLDMGAKHVLIPFERLSDPTPTTIRAEFPRWRAEQAPDYDPKTTRDYEPYFDYWYPERGPANPDPSLTHIPDQTAAGHGPLLRISRAAPWQLPPGLSDFRGAEVADMEGNTIGVVDDFFFSMLEQRPEIVVIRRGGLLGFLSHETMVPYERLISTGDEKFTAQVTREELLGAPELKDEIYDYTPFFDYWKVPQHRRPVTRETAAV